MSHKEQYGYSLEGVKQMCIERYGRLPRAGYEIDMVVDTKHVGGIRYLRVLYLVNRGGSYGVREWTGITEVRK